MKTRAYFEPASRLQLLDKLRHMVRFSDFLLLVSGEKGAGKSALIDQIKPESHDTTLCCLVVRPESTLDDQQLLNILLQQLPSHDQGGTGFADHLKLFYLQIKALKSSGRKCLIIVDDVERLSRPALDLLINLHQADSATDSAQLLLLSGSKFATSILQMPGIKALDGRLHHQVLMPLSGEEVEEYLDVCHPEASSLAEKKRDQLIHLSEGLPGRIEALLSGQKVAARQNATTKAFPLPAIHMAGIGLVLIAILGISLWQFFPQDENNEAVKEVSGDTLSLPLPVPALNPTQENSPEEIKVVESTSSEDDPTAATSELKKTLSDRLAEQEIKLQEEKSEVAVAPRKEVAVEQLTEELKEVVRSEVSSPNKVEPKQTSVMQDTQPAISKPVVLPPTPSEPKTEIQVSSVTKSNPIAAESDILGWAKSGYTLQMLGARSEQSAIEFIQAQKEPQNFYYFSTIYKGAPWHVVVYGQYANRDVANAAIKKLPIELQKIKPWARSVQGVQLDIKKK